MELVVVIGMGAWLVGAAVFYLVMSGKSSGDKENEK